MHPSSAPPPPLKLAEPAQTPPAKATEATPHKEKTEKPPTQKSAKDWTQAVRQHIRKLDDAGQFYPPEAIARGLQGEVLVLMILDEDGKVVAARVEQSSGHPILDEAALRTVRSITSIPADAPRQVVLPVRFRLR